VHPRIFAQSKPDHPALVLSTTGDTSTYGELETRANQGAHLLRSLGLKTGDTIGIDAHNHAGYLEIYWSAQRAGLYLVPISTSLSAPEIAYMLNDSQAKLLIVSAEAGAGAIDIVRERATAPTVKHIFYTGGAVEGARSWREAIAQFPATPVADESPGGHMSYSSGTTGKPKGIRHPLPTGPVVAKSPIAEMISTFYGVDESSVYLSPAPLYHNAPLGYCTTLNRVGGTVVMLPKFDPILFLEAVEKYRINIVQVVPTHFVRLLKLPDTERLKYDMSSLKHVVHAAAPCPVATKYKMIEWLGPIITEYYGASEANGGTQISSEEWLRKPGSVGRANWGVIHICDEEGRPLPTGETGIVYFEGGSNFSYHNDQAKTDKARNPLHPTWTTVGDIGHVDEDGYLFLTDRKDFMIISGGVNVYPQEAENLLVTHPAVADAAVFGIPNPDFGEEVKAVVQPVDWSRAGPELEAELIAFCRSRLSHIKCPRTIDFERSLPRTDAGKLYKKPLKARYWPASV
jgi:acyl-CoA synthetase (AMP-forming)/AMP-acid ligase II